MLIKICGMTRHEDTAVAIAAGADMLGFIFVSGTPRALDPSRVSWVREIVGAETVGVFRDVSLEEAISVRDALALDRVQLHGNEPDTFLDSLGPKTLRRVRPENPVDWERLAELNKRCLPLLDPGAGDGHEWAWDALAERPQGIRFGLAGGLTPENVAEAVRTVRPHFVDVSTGVEATPGIKDHEKIKAFIVAARSVSPQIT